MKKSILLLSFTLSILFTLNAQITDLKFLIEYNDTTSLYDCKIVITGGGAMSYPHRILFNSQYTIVVPAGTDLTIEELHAPKENNQFYTGTVPCLWEFGPKEFSPPTAPQNDYHVVFANLSPPSAFNDLNAGDTITLFSLSADVDPCENAIRAFEYGIDPQSIDMPSGGDYNCGMTLGSASQLFDGNLSTDYMNNYISQNDSLSTCLNDCINLEPTIQCFIDDLKYEWSTGDTTETIEVCPTEPSNYYVLIKDLNDDLLDSLPVHIGIEPLYIKTTNNVACAGSSIILEACPGSGIWSQSSANGFGATLSSVSEGVTEVTFSNGVSGSFDIIFSIPGLKDTIKIFVYPAPLVNIAASQICINENTVAASNIPGGLWVSNNTGVATIDALTGLITGNSAGNVTFSYTSPIGCSAVTNSLTVIPYPVATITGSDIICLGGNTFVSPTSGGTWASSDNAVATVTNAGVVTGVGLGLATLYFTETLTGCASEGLEIEVFEMPIPTFIGPDSICINGTSSLSPSTGGFWLSSNNLVATIDNSGNITAMNAGTAVFTYSNNLSGCSPITSNTLWVFDEQITTTIVDTELCIGETTQAIPTNNGTWTSDNPVVATITPFGLITGVSEGTTRFRFTSSTSNCISDPSVEVTVNGVPEVTLLGHNEICIGISSQMLPSSGGTWTSSDPSIISIDNNGVFTANAEGNVTFTWTDDLTGCPSLPSEPVFASLVISTELTGPDQICIGSTTTIEPNVGGTWSSTDPSIATIDNFGNITGVGIGITQFVYISAAGQCQSDPSAPVLVTAGPIIDVPSTSLCEEETMYLSPSEGGTWTSSTPMIGYISPGTNLVTALSPGTVTFTFTETSSGCSTSETVTVYEKPEIDEESPYIICKDLSTIIGSSSEGTWTSSDPSVVTVLNTGQITTLSEGIAHLIFTDSSSGCQSDPLEMTVIDTIATPSPSNNGPVCEGEDIQLTSDLVPEANYRWSGPNGFIDFHRNTTIPNATASDAGTYCLEIIFNGCSSDYGCTEVIVDPSPETPIAYTNSPICEYEDIYLSTDAVTDAVYYWLGPNGFTSTDQNPVLSSATSANSGSYCVIVTVDGCQSIEGCTDVIVLPTPATPIASNNGPICEGEDLELYTESVTGATFAWTGPDGFSSTVQNPIIVAASSNNAGSYCVVVTIDGCSSEAGCTDVGSDCPCEIMDNSITQSDPNEYCGESEVLTILGSDALPNGGSYTWEYSSNNGVFVPASGINDQRDYTIEVLGVGSHTFRRVFTVETPIECENISNEIFIIVYENADAGPDQQLECYDYSVAIMEANGSGIWSWGSTPGGDLPFIDLFNPNAIVSGFAYAGKYSLIWTTEEGCIDEILILVGSNCECQIEENFITQPDLNEFCGESEELTILGSDALPIEGTYTWEYSLNNGVFEPANGINDQRDYNTELLGVGSHTFRRVFTVVNPIPCDDASNMIIVNVLPSPSTPTISHNGPICEGESLDIYTEFITGATYQWTGPNGFTSNQQNLTLSNVTQHESGSYCLTTNINGCESEINCTDVLIISTPAMPSPSYNGPICEDFDLELNTNNVAGATFAWTGPGGFFSTDQNPILTSVHTSSSGIYCVIVSIDGCDSEEACIDVIINPGDPSPTILSNSIVCIGDDLELSTEELPNGIYEWTGPNGFQSNIRNPIIPSVSIDYSGTYTLHASSAMSQCPYSQAIIKEIEIINCFDPYLACDEIGADDIICNFDELAGVAGSLSNENSAGNQPSGFLCDSNDEAQNISWFGFVALEGDFDIVINTTNCFIDNGIVGGVQIGVYSDCSFSNESEVFCENNYEAQNEIRISSNSLIPGQTYFLFIDGIQSSLCDYSIDIDGFYDNTYCTDLSKVTGVAYIDDNENGIYDLGETLLRNALISLSPGNFSVLTNNEGKYIINTPKGGATLTAKMNEGHWINDELIIEDLTVFETCVEGIDFGFVPNLFYQEANVSVANSITRCDWESKFYFTVENTGTVDLDANFEFEFDDKASYFSTNHIGLQVNGNKASGNLGVMAPFEVREFWITLKMPPGSSVLPILDFKTTLYNSGGVEMDEYEQSEQLRCSYDPNDKREYPNREGEENFTLMDENLEYTIRFQNNGNDTAFQVKIVDPLDPNIDPTSIRVINSSHAVETCIENENLIFIFENINLVDSMTNYEGSQGFVSFRCNTKEDRLENTIVHNTADIIFDTNEPIVTNTTINTLVSELCTYTTSEIDIEICEGDNYHGYEESGTYTEVFPLQYGCDSTVIINLDVQGITYSSQNIEICEGEPFDLNGKEYTLYESQVLRDSLENAQGCLSNVFIFNVEVNPVLMIEIDTVICEGYEYNGFSETGIYTVESFDEVTGCDIITTINLDVLPKSDASCLVGIDELDNSEIKIYPIPAKDVFFLEGETIINSISIYTMDYQKVEELKFDVGSQKIQLTTDKLIQGLYIIAVESKGQIIYKKLIVE